MKIINTVGNIVVGTISAAMKGILYLILGSIIGAVLITFLLASIIFTAF